MAPIYPTTIPTAGQVFDPTDDVDWMNAAEWHQLRDELIAALTELGTLPKGAAADVKTLLASLAPKASPVFTGDVTIPTITLSGGQIKFPATASPSADTNTLDDYEEGTWTPAITFGGASVGVTYAAERGGFYTKIGDRVCLTGSFKLTSKGESVGDAVITGLPFTVINAWGADPPPALKMDNIAFANVFQGKTNEGGAIVTLYEVTEGGVMTALTDADFANDSRIAISITYKIA